MAGGGSDVRAEARHATTQDRGVPDSDARTGRQFSNGSVEAGFEYPCETEPIRAQPTARLVVSAVNRSTLTRVSSRSEISASVLTSHGRETTVNNSRLLSPHTSLNTGVQSIGSSIDNKTDFLTAMRYFFHGGKTTAFRRAINAYNTGVTEA